MHLTRSAIAVLSAALIVSPAYAQGGRGGDATRTSYPLDRIVAVVGKKSITRTELIDQIGEENVRRQEAGRRPFDPDDSLKTMKMVVEGMIDAALLLQKAEEFKFPIKEEELNTIADQQIKQIRDQRFKTDREFQEALRNEGINSVDELRRRFVEQERHRRLQRMTIDTLTKLGQMPQISVSERDISQAFDTLKSQMPARGPTVSFRQIVMKPVWTDSADARAKALADSLLTLLKAGANFDSLAMKFTDDDSTKALGGDLGWFRRGQMTEAFDKMAFSLTIGQLSPLVKTEYGYHIIRVDRLRPGEVRARHILIMPKKDVKDLVRARVTLEKAIEALRKGASFDSLADLYHDGLVHRRKVENRPLTELPPEYIKALDSLKAGDYAPVFEVTMPNGDMNKAALVQLMSRNESGEWTLDEAREQIRGDLRQAGSWRRLLDTLRKQTYVSVRIEDPAARAGK